MIGYWQDAYVGLIEEGCYQTFLSIHGDHQGDPKGALPQGKFANASVSTLHTFLSEK